MRESEEAHFVANAKNSPGAQNGNARRNRRALEIRREKNL
jgi:hypothetical protein